MKKQYAILLVTFGIFLLSYCQGDPLTYPTGSFVSAEALKVYGVALDSLHVEHDQDIIYILDSTIVVFSFAMRSYEHIKNGYPEFEQETYASLLANNNRRYSIPSLPTNTKRNLFLSSNPSSRLGEPNVYGVVEFSNVGFNKNKTQAVLLVFEYRGDLAGSIYFLTLAIKNNAWQVTSYVLVGIS